MPVVSRSEKQNAELHDRVMFNGPPLPSSARFPSCSLKRTALGRDWDWGAAGGCTWDRSSASLRLASRSCSVDRLGPASTGVRLRGVSGGRGWEGLRRKSGGGKKKRLRVKEGGEGELKNEEAKGI